MTSPMSDMQACQAAVMLNAPPAARRVP
jgi:hypothetical protein